MLALFGWDEERANAREEPDDLELAHFTQIIRVKTFAINHKLYSFWNLTTRK